MPKQYDINPEWDAKRKKWRVRVQKDGVRKAFTSATPGRAGKKDVLDRAEKWLAGGMSDRDPTVAEVAEEWLEEVLQNTGKTSWRQYNSHVRNYIVPSIGHLRMSQLTNEQQIQNVINKAFKSGARDGRELSAKTLMNLRGTLSALLRYARKSGYTTLHMESVQIPKRAKRGERRTMQPEEIRTLFRASNTMDHRKAVPDRLIHAYRFQVLTGLRPGELIGLQWRDITDGKCSIRRSINYHGEITPGKNANARRTFIVPPLALRELEEQKAMLESEGVDSEYVFPDDDGDPLCHWDYRRALLRYCRHNGIEDTCPYELRHTWYSINKALPAELVKQMGGHSESMDTFGIYGHQIDGEAERFAGMLNDTIESLLGTHSGAHSDSVDVNRSLPTDE